MLAPFDIVFSPHDVVEPDLIYFAADRFKEIVGERNAQGPPDLAIEVLSPSTRELSLEDNTSVSTPMLPDLGVPLKRVFEMP